MKKFIVLLFAIIVVSQAFSQKKKGKTDPKDVQIDTLTKATQTLTRQVDSLNKLTGALTDQLDSVSQSLKSYAGLYTVIKEKVLKHDFDPAKLPHIIDSLAAGRDSLFSGANASSASLKDSLSSLKGELSVLKRMNVEANTTLSDMTVEETDRNRLINELKQLKELLDTKILTQTEFDARKSKVLQKWK